jgi:hypothetical protein
VVLASDEQSAEPGEEEHGDDEEAGRVEPKSSMQILVLLELRHSEEEGQG